MYLLKSFSGDVVPIRKTVRNCEIIVDGGAAFVDILVAPDHLCSVDVILGNSFFQQPQVTFIKERTEIKFYGASEKRSLMISKPTNGLAEMISCDINHHQRYCRF